MLVSKTKLDSLNWYKRNSAPDDFKGPSSWFCVPNTDRYPVQNSALSSLKHIPDDFKESSPKTLAKRKGGLTAQEALKHNSQRIKSRQLMLKEKQTTIRTLEETVAAKTLKVDTMTKERKAAEAKAEAAEAKAEAAEAKAIALQAMIDKIENSKRKAEDLPTNEQNEIKKQKLTIKTSCE